MKKRLLSISLLFLCFTHDGEAQRSDDKNPTSKEQNTAATSGAKEQAHMAIDKNKTSGGAQVTDKRSSTGNISKSDVFSKGEPAPAHFTGKAWVSMLVNSKDYDLSSYNVTFAPGARNDWHSHAVGQVLLCTVGIGYYQERGKAPRRLSPGDVVEIPANTEHWHGAAPQVEFVHIGISPKMSENKVTWGDPVTDEEYAKATAER